MAVRIFSIPFNMTMNKYLLIPTFAFLLSRRVQAEGGCERLKTSLTYTQEEAPRDLSGVLPVVVERVNQVLEGVVDVEVEWQGSDLQGRVGEHMVECTVTRLAESLRTTDQRMVTKDDQGRDVVTQCFHVPFSILDTNECTLPMGHPMRHQCHASAMCVNTVGSYECLCPRLSDDRSVAGTTVEDSFWEHLAKEQRSPWERSFERSSRTSCPNAPSTYDCCPTRVHVKEGAECRAAFVCPTDPCRRATDNTCVSQATCVRAAKPSSEPNYTCQCPDGLMGNGHVCRPGVDPKPEPKITFEGEPTEETIKNNFYCDCTTPMVDACSGYPPCKGKHEVCRVTAGNVPQCTCKPGYVMHEKYGCVDESPPLLRLKNDPRGDQTLRLKQGDVYKEYAVEIQDENAEEYLRSLKIAYSKPLPNGCFTEIGEFHVNYTVATPWTSPPYVRVTRRVVIEDIDECSIDVSKYETTCPSIVPQCDTEAGAKCVNTIGSYTCECPKFTSGDGFRKGWSPTGRAPKGYKEGNSCRDTHKPVIQLRGPNPKVFRVCACGGIPKTGEKTKDSDLRRTQQNQYSDNVKELVRSTAGSELCATHSHPNPKASDCVRAIDETYKGNVDLSRNVRVGEPVQKSALHWAVPYDVSDYAGNAAITVWRDVIVEEVELTDLEAKIHREVMKDKEKEIRLAVTNALEKAEKEKIHEIQLAIENDRQKRGARDTRGARSCPACPKCDCSGSFDPPKCETVCGSGQGSCTVHEDSLVVRFLVWAGDCFPFVPIDLFEYGLAVTIAALVYYSARWIYALLSSSARRPKTYIASDERERAMQSSVSVYRSGDRIMNGVGSAGYPPPTSMSVGATPASLQQQPGIFSPQGSTGGFSGYNGASPPFRSPRFGSPSPAQSGSEPRHEDIYASPDVITPRRRRGEQTPFSR